MPLTFPSHAAAILPLRLLPGVRRLPTSALVIGSTAPDLTYLIGTYGADSHHPLGLLTFCLPAGVVAFLLLEALLLPVLAPLLVTLLPQRLGRTGVRVLGPRPLPNHPAGWLAVAAAVLLGAVTHQLWDGFTHAWMWPARVLYPGVTLSLAGQPVLLSRVLQHLSSALGAVIVLLYLVYSAPSRPAVLVPQDRAGVARQLFVLLLLPALGGALAVANQLRHPYPRFSRTLWEAGWSAVAWFTLLLSALCWLVRLRESRRR